MAKRFSRGYKIRWANRKYTRIQIHQRRKEAALERLLAMALAEDCYGFRIDIRFGVPVALLDDRRTGKLISITEASLRRRIKNAKRKGIPYAFSELVFSALRTATKWECR